MDADPENVIAVHCKGGKGRTGTMICIWLLESKQYASASVDFYNCIKQTKLNYFFIFRKHCINLETGEQIGTREKHSKVSKRHHNQDLWDITISYAIN